MRRFVIGAVAALTLVGVLGAPAAADTKVTKKERKAAIKALDKAYGDCLDADLKHPDRVARKGGAIVIEVDDLTFYVPRPPKAAGVTPADSATRTELVASCAP